MRRFALLLVTAAVLMAVFAATPATAQSTSGATSVTIELPAIIILHYYDSVDVTITASALGTYLGYTFDPGTTSVNESAATSSGGFTQDLALDPTNPTGDLGNVNLVLENAWGVRGILGTAAGADQIQVTIAATDSQLDNGAASITIDSASVSPSAAFNPPGLAAETVGDVTLVLDLTSATLAGDYTGGEYTLTASAV